MKEDLHQLRERYEEAKSYKLRWLSLYQELYFYVMPNRDAFNELFNYEDQGKPVANQVWDDTAMLAAYQRANDLHGLLLPKDRVWGKLTLDPHFYNEEIVDDQSVKEIMDEVNDRIFFYINQSNLSRVVSSSNLDLVGGTGAIWVESHSDRVPIYFRSIPAVSLFIEYSTDDLINTCWFTQKMTGRTVLKNFPKYRGKLRDRFIDNPNEKYAVNFGQIKLKDEHYYIYAVMEDDPYSLLFEAERSYPQIIVYRDRVRPGEAEGRGIGIDMLPTIRDLNHMVRDSRKNMAFKANPPLFVDDDSFLNVNSIRQWAGAMISRNPQGRNPIEALQMPEYPDVFNHILALQETIKRGFQIDPLGEIQSPVKSATEISIRENRAQRSSATDISRLINELPKQIYEVSAKILHERNLLLKNRQSLKGFSPKMLRFNYTSPLYDIQNQEDLNHFVTNLQIKQQFFGQGAAMASTNLIEASKFLTEKLNLPHKVFATDEELKQFLQGLVQQQQLAQLPQPTSSTSSSPVQLPQNPGITI